jgi:cold shock protein
MVFSTYFRCQSKYEKGGLIVPKGKVKWFSNQKGYGFIESDEGKDVFVHYQDIQGDGFKTLEEEDEVEYDLADGEKGLKALNVVRIV